MVAIAAGARAGRGGTAGVASSTYLRGTSTPRPKPDPPPQDLTLPATAHGTGVGTVVDLDLVRNAGLGEGFAEPGQRLAQGWFPATNSPSRAVPPTRPARRDRPGRGRRRRHRLARAWPPPGRAPPAPGPAHDADAIRTYIGLPAQPAHGGPQLRQGPLVRRVGRAAAAVSGGHRQGRVADAGQVPRAFLQPVRQSLFAGDQEDAWQAFARPAEPGSRSRLRRRW